MDTSRKHQQSMDQASVEHQEALADKPNHEKESAQNHQKEKIKNVSLRNYEISKKEPFSSDDVKNTDSAI